MGVGGCVAWSCSLRSILLLFSCMSSGCQEADDSLSKAVPHGPLQERRIPEGLGNHPCNDIHEIIVKLPSVMASESSNTPLSPSGSTGGELWRSLAAAQTEIGELRAQVKSLSSKIKERDKSISDLKAENARLRSAGASHDVSVREGQEAEVKKSSLSPAMGEE